MVLQAEAPSRETQPRWRRVFDTLSDEHDYVVDEVEGRLPEGLVGTLYRNGPGKTEVGGKPYAHLFDGDALLSQFTFDGKRVRYRNRFVRTTHYLAERSAREPRLRNYGTERSGGPLGNAFRRPANVANTSVAYHAGNLLALYEGGRPWQVDPDTLETIGEYDFDGDLKRGYLFSAHPTWDPATGEMFNFGVELGPRPRLRIYRVDARGRLHHLPSVPLQFHTLNHDFAMTDKHLVFVIDPLVVKIGRFVLGLSSLDESVRFDATKQTQVILVPRDGGKARIAECEPFFHYHINNAFEDGSDTVLDLVRYPDYDDIHRSLRRFKDDDAPNPSTTFSRVRVSPANRVTIDDIGPVQCEFPQHDWRLTTSRHRFAYLAGDTTGDGTFNSLIKVDHDRDVSSAHELGAGQVAGEPIFVPRSQDSAEDDGWLLSVVYSAPEHRSRLVVLDARDVEAEPVAQAHLRHHVPFGFHGTFTPRIAA